MNRSEKQQAVETISGKFADSPAAFLVDYKGCSCATLTSLRKDLRGIGAEFGVIKNTLAKIALADTDASSLGKDFTGPTAIVWTGDDRVSPAKILTQFVKDEENCSIKSGIVDGEIVDVERIKQIAEMPSKEELLSKLLALIAAPATQMVRVLNAPASDLVRLLAAWKDELGKKED